MVRQSQKETQTQIIIMTLQFVKKQVKHSFTIDPYQVTINYLEYGSVEASYKDPYLDMFNDLEALLNGDGISERDVVELYRSISDATREDCETCDNSPELNNLSIFAASVSGLLRKYVGMRLFKWEAMNKTAMAKTMVQNLPDSLTIKVDPESSILEYRNKKPNYQKTPTRH